MDKIKIKRFDKELPLPEYKTAGAAGFDLYAREKTTINPGAVGYVPLNVALETPRDHFLILAVRSSTHKLGLMPANGIGIGDSDFRGDEDEYKIVLLNFTKAKWQEVDKMSSKTRGGFGSTGKK